MQTSAIFIRNSRDSNNSEEFQNNSKNSDPTMKPMTSKSYQEEVLKKYRREKGGEMRGYLANPTRRQIREACIWLLDKRKSRHDEHTLNRFFQFQEGKNKVIQLQQFKADRFRPIVNFLKGKTNDTGPENLELIAWLIDFHPRPYEEFLKSDNPAYTRESEKHETDHGDPLQIFDTPIPPTNPEGPIKKRRRLIILIRIAIVSILLPFLVLIFWPSGNNGLPNPSDTDKCMAWADSVYIKVPCTSKPYSRYGTKVEPIDKIKLDNFKRVEVNMATPFFSEDDKPLIWYHKNTDGEIEYYTAPGLHPINGETLRKITPHIIETYVPLHSNSKSSFLQEN